jgi:hypothetical protein
MLPLSCSRRICLVALALSALLRAEPASAIVGMASPEAALSSSVVMVLQREGSTAGFCTGIVLAPNVVLTAAHCVPKGADLRIHYPGDPANPVMIAVTGVARHPDFHADAITARERSIDLAMVHLRTSLPDTFKPATLAKAGGAKLGARFVVTGYGVGKEGEAATSGTLRSAVLTTRAPLSNVLLWSEDPAKGGLGACTGDSGGPVRAEGSDAVSAMMLWSAGPEGHQCGDLTQSLWLAPHRAWIDRVLQAWGAAPGL